MKEDAALRSVAGSAPSAYYPAAVGRPGGAGVGSDLKHTKYAAAVRQAGGACDGRAAAGDGGRTHLNG
jgi:hypothetical protein